MLSEYKQSQTFVFSVPALFTLIILLFYFFYLRRRRVDWSSLRMRTMNHISGYTSRGSEAGIKKEFREMLPIVIFKQSFLIRETQCSVCLGDYEPEEKLQQIPSCGHTFHVECIDHWLIANITCPLCRAPIISSSKQSLNLTEDQTNSSQIVEISNQNNCENIEQGTYQERKDGTESHCSSSNEEFLDASGGSVEERPPDEENSIVIHVIAHESMEKTEEHL